MRAVSWRLSRVSANRNDSAPSRGCRFCAAGQEEIHQDGRAEDGRRKTDEGRRKAGDGMMRWLLWGVFGLALLVALVVIIGWRLPKGHTASRTARVRTTARRCVSAADGCRPLSDLAAGCEDTDAPPHHDRRPAWIEESGGMKIPLYFERMERPSLLVTRIADPQLPFGGTWMYRIVPAPGRVRADDHRRRRGDQSHVPIHVALRLRPLQDARRVCGESPGTGAMRGNGDRS